MLILGVITDQTVIVDIVRFVVRYRFPRQFPGKLFEYFENLILRAKYQLHFVAIIVVRHTNGHVMVRKTKNDNKKKNQSG